MDLIEARSKILGTLFSCPVCGAGPVSIEKSDGLETVEFVCDAAFYLPTGGVAAVSRICSGPSYVAANHIERQAKAMVAKAVACR